jgi:hypothetical protein
LQYLIEIYAVCMSVIQFCYIFISLGFSGMDPQGNPMPPDFPLVPPVPADIPMDPPVPQPVMLGPFPMGQNNHVGEYLFLSRHW